MESVQRFPKWLTQEPFELIHDGDGNFIVWLEDGQYEGRGTSIAFAARDADLIRKDLAAKS